MKKSICFAFYLAFLVTFPVGPAFAQKSCDALYAEYKAAKAKFESQQSVISNREYLAASNKFNACINAGGTLGGPNAGNTPGGTGPGNTTGSNDNPNQNPVVPSLLPYKVRVVAEAGSCGKVEKEVVFTGTQDPNRIYVDGEVLNANGKGIKGAKLKLFDPSGMLLKTGETESHSGLFMLIHKLNGDANPLQKDVELRYSKVIPTTVTISAKGHETAVETIDRSKTNNTRLVKEQGVVREVLTDALVKHAELVFECDGKQETVKTDKNGAFNTSFLVDGCCLGHENADATYYLERGLQIKLIATAKGHVPEERVFTFSALNLPDFLTIRGEVNGGRPEYPFPWADARVTVLRPDGSAFSRPVDKHGKYEIFFKPFLTKKDEGHRQTIEPDVVFKLKPTRLSVKMDYRPQKLGSACKEHPKETAVVLANYDVPINTQWRVELDGKPVEDGRLTYEHIGFYRNQQRINYVWSQVDLGSVNVSNGWTEAITFDSPGTDPVENQHDVYPVYGKFLVTYNDGLTDHEAELEYMVLNMRPALIVRKVPGVLMDGMSEYARTFELKIRSWGQNHRRSDVFVGFDGEVEFYDMDTGYSVKGPGWTQVLGQPRNAECTTEELVRFSVTPGKQTISANAYLHRKDLNLEQLSLNLIYLGVETLTHDDLLNKWAPGLKGSAWNKAPGWEATGFTIYQTGDKVAGIYKNDPLYQRLLSGELGANQYEISETVLNATDVFAGVIDIGMAFGGAALKKHYMWQALKANYTIWKHNYEYLLKVEAYQDMIDEWVPLRYEPVYIQVRNEYGRTNVKKQVPVYEDKPATGQGR